MRHAAFPGVRLRRGTSDSAAVRILQKVLNARGCGPLEPNGTFGDETEAALRLFQMRFPDAQGQALTVDGACGPLTWAALFGAGAQFKLAQPAPCGRSALAVAVGELGHMEVPLGSNAGPKVEKYLASVGLGPGFAWCAAFVYWCASQVGANALPRAGAVEKMWHDGQAAGLPVLSATEALAEPARIAPGMVFFLAHGAGTGHTGFVEGLHPDGRLITIEGNANDGGLREGIGVFRLQRRSIASINLGFLSLA